MILLLNMYIYENRGKHSTEIDPRADFKKAWLHITILLMAVQHRMVLLLLHHVVQTTDPVTSTPSEISEK